MRMDEPPSPAAGETTQGTAAKGRGGPARGMAVAGSAAVAVGVFGLGYACTGAAAPPAAQPGPPVSVTTQTPEPATHNGVLPADRTQPSTAPCATTRRPAGWSRAENAKPGDSSWRASFNADTSVVAGYLDQVSAACGDSVNLHLSGYVS